MSGNNKNQSTMMKCTLTLHALKAPVSDGISHREQIFCFGCFLCIFASLHVNLRAGFFLVVGGVDLPGWSPVPEKWHVGRNR